MRIISGIFRGRKLKSPGKTGSAIRPTADRAREALFNILAPRLVGSRVLDLFAGTGALALEALSRGAGAAVAVDNGSQAMALLLANRASCGCEDSLRLVKRSLAGNLTFLLDIAAEHGPFELIFMDPPYGKGLSLPLLDFMAEQSDILADNGIIIVEDVAKSQFPEQVGGCILQDTRSYGTTGFWIYGRR